MPDIPINQKPFFNVDNIGNKVALYRFIDFEKDDFMNNKMRQGLGGSASNCFVDLASTAKIDGIFYIPNYDFIAVVSNGYIYKVTSSGAATQITGDTLEVGTIVSFADFGSTGYFCNGGRIVKWVYGAATCAYITDADAPTDVIFVGFLDQYLIALRANSARFEFSDVNLPDTWLGEYATAESRPDNAVCLLSAFGEIMILGTGTIEHWSDSGDPTMPFQRLQGAITERGSISPYSFAQIDNSFFFLDSERRVIRMSGRSPEVIGNDIDKLIQELSTVQDAIGYHYNAEGATKYVLTFPTDEKTYVYDYKLQYWSEWTYYDKTYGKRENYLGRVGRFIPKWNKYIIGSREDGRLYIASKEYTTDKGDNIISEFQTARIDWDTSDRKSSKRLSFKVERGTNAVGDIDTPKLYMSKRDNGASQWSSERQFNLGNPGDDNSYIRIRNLGQYRDRQYRIRMEGARSLLCRMAEDIEVVS